MTARPYAADSPEIADHLRRIQHERMRAIAGEPPPAQPCDCPSDHDVRGELVKLHRLPCPQAQPA